VAAMRVPAEMVTMTKIKRLRNGITDILQRRRSPAGEQAFGR
jgi:hypothetical protein